MSDEPQSDLSNLSEQTKAEMKAGRESLKKHEEQAAATSCWITHSWPTNFPVTRLHSPSWRQPPSTTLPF